MAAVWRYPDAGAMAEMIRLGREMHADSTYAHVPYDVDDMTQIMGNALACPERIYVAAAYRNGLVVGGMLGRIEPYYFNRAVKVASDMALYVTPDSRGGVGAKELIADFEAWARENGAVDVVLGSTASKTPAAAALLYERLGYGRLGFVTRKQLAGG